MNIDDRATELEEMAREDALRYRMPVPERDGRCASCRKPLDAELIYCDRDCQIDHERIQDAQRRNGK